MIDRAAVVNRDARDLIFEEKFLTKSIHGGGDQENDPKSFEKMPSIPLNNALIVFTLNLPVARIVV